MPFHVRRFTAGKDDDGRRLDRIVRVLFPGIPLSALYRLFRNGDARLNGAKASGDRRVAEGDTLELRLPDDERFAKPSPRPDASAKAIFEAMILVRTPDIVVVGKPRGMLSHGKGGVDELAAAYFDAESSASLAFRPAPLHRLDRNTSGALVVSASIRGARAFSAALRDGLIKKEYIGVLAGSLDGTVEWRDFLERDGYEGVSSVSDEGKKAARTIVSCLAQADGRTLALVRIETGLTHQIRAQCAAHGFPLAGDSKYGGGSEGSYVLHCARLGFPRCVEAEFPTFALAPLSPEAKSALAGFFGPSWRRSLPAHLGELALD